MRPIIKNHFNFEANLENTSQNNLVNPTDKKSCQTFYVEDEKTRTSSLFTLPIGYSENQKDGFCNLYDVFAKIENLELKYFNIFNAKECQFHNIKNIVIDHSTKQCQIHDQNFWSILKENLGLVTIKYTDDEPPTPSIASANFKMNQIIFKKNQEKQKETVIVEIKDKKKSKGGRSSERTIQEVISLVKKWRSDRNLAKISTSLSCKRKSLLESASSLGISKKSLDDYYYQLRNGERFGFDFLANLDKKVGFLRSFLKDKIPKKEAGKKNEKHGKELLIIEQEIDHETPSASFTDHYESITQTKSETPECYPYQELDLDLLDIENQSIIIEEIYEPFEDMEDSEYFGEY